MSHYWCTWFLVRHGSVEVADDSSSITICICLPNCKISGAITKTIIICFSQSVLSLHTHFHTHRAVILVIDSVNFDKELGDVAGLVYDILSDPVIHKKKIPLLMACNKQDHVLARHADAISKHLEKEM